MEPICFLIYLAGPISNIGLEKARCWRRLFADLLLRRLVEDNWDGPTVILYDPANAFSWSQADEAAWRIAMQIDDLAVQAATVLVAQFLPGIKSRGTDREVTRAMALRKHVIAFGPDSVYTVKRLALRVAMLDIEPEPPVVICPSLEDAMQCTIGTLQRLNEAW